MSFSQPSHRSERFFKDIKNQQQWEKHQNEATGSDLHFGEKALHARGEGIFQGPVWEDGCDDGGEDGVYTYLDEREEPPDEGEGGE